MVRNLQHFQDVVNHEINPHPLHFAEGMKIVRSQQLLVFCRKPGNGGYIITKPNTPKTNGMVERVNATIKNGTVLKGIYSNKNEMNSALIAFLVHYVLYIRHGGPRRELKVKTPMQAIEKWFDMRPGIFKQKPLEFKNKILALKNFNDPGFHKQPCET